MRKQNAEVSLSIDQIVFLFGLIVVTTASFFIFRISAIRLVITVITLFAFVSLVFELITEFLSRSSPKPKLTIPEEELPKMTLLSPMYKEVNVLRRHIQKAAEISWPKDRLDHMLLIREEDIDLLDALKTISLPDHMRVLRIPPEYYGSKPAALEYALADTTGMFYLILDAENVPDPRLLELTYQEWYASPIRDQLGGVSAVPVVSNWHGSPVAKDITGTFRQQFGNLLDRKLWSWMLPMHQGAEYAKHYQMITRGSLKLGLTPLPGNSVLFLTEAVHAVGGYDRHNKAEDADLAVALARHGYKIASVECDTYEEAPKTFASWFKQRRRWMDGFLQTFFSHAREPRALVSDLGFLNTLLFLHYFGVRPFLQLINPLVIGMTVLYGMTLFPQVQHLNPEMVASMSLTLQEIYTPQAKAMGMVIMFLGTFHYFETLLVACAGRKMWKSMPFMLLAPVYWFAQSMAQVWAVKDFLTHAPWHLTEHDLEESAEVSVHSLAFMKNATTYAESGD